MGMHGENGLLLGVVVITVLLLVLIVLVGFLLVLNSSRRNRHRAEMAQADHLREVEARKAEREATRRTLNEVAKELHDNVAQLLTVASMGMANALMDRADDRLEVARGALDQGVEEVRRLGRSLHSDQWKHRTFSEAVVEEASRIRRASRMEVTVELEDGTEALTEEESTMLYRVFQEVLANVLRHSGASNLLIRLSAGPDALLEVADNGRGFDPTLASRHNGLRNIHERCALIGFVAHCGTAPGKGCVWSFRRQV